ncbi:MAG: HD domain-containing protein [Planctomycetes bacterium]|nr:HD domain-containing protein [Planctomycetota bacterium]
MIRVPLSSVEPGMILAAPVWHPGVGQHVLLRADYRLDADCIARLDRLAVEGVWIRHPGFDFLDEKLRDEIPRSRAKLYACVKRSFGGIANQTMGAFDLIEYRTVVSEMILALVANRNNAVWAQRLMDTGDEMFAHCANVAYLSLVIGMRIKDYIVAQRRHVSQVDAADLTNLGIGAMLHDLGKLGLDPKWRNVHCLDEGTDTEEYRSHAERGHRAVQGRIEATAAQVLLHHHQRFDGDGFPRTRTNSAGRTTRPMKGTNIHVFSRIVAVANAIDAQIRTCRERNLPLVAGLAAIQRSPFETMFDPVVLDAGLRVIPPFPLGACVQLTDGRQAVVTDLHESKPCQPVVRLLSAADAEESEGEDELDLSASGSPAIVSIGDQAVDGQFLYTLAERSLTTRQQTDRLDVISPP